MYTSLDIALYIILESETKYVYTSIDIALYIILEAKRRHWSNLYLNENIHKDAIYTSIKKT